MAVYLDVETQKKLIIKENKGKSGIYCWINKENGKFYIGSSSNLGRRFSGYFSINFLRKVKEKNKSIIYESLLKNGYSKFSLEILEYCENEKAVILKKEQEYIDLLDPEYNICKTAGSSLGFKHSEETKEKLRVMSLNFSEETKQKISQAQIGNTKRWGVGVGRVEVIDLETKESFIFTSMAEAGEMLGVTKQAISLHFKKTDCFIFRDRYQVKKIGATTYCGKSSAFKQ